MGRLEEESPTSAHKAHSYECLQLAKVSFVAVYRYTSCFFSDISSEENALLSARGVFLVGAFHNKKA